MTTKKQILKRVYQAKTRIAKERDILRELIEELEELESNCDAARDDLESAAEVLSRLL